MVKRNKKFEVWALKELKYFQKVLCLEIHGELELQPTQKKTDAIALCNFTYPYTDISIEYTDELVDLFNKKEFQKCRSILLHEMCHPLTDPLYSKAYERFITKGSIEDERERLTDHISKIVMRLLINKK